MPIKRRLIPNLIETVLNIRDDAPQYSEEQLERLISLAYRDLPINTSTNIFLDAVDKLITQFEAEELYVSN